MSSAGQSTTTSTTTTDPLALALLPTVFPRQPQVVPSEIAAGPVTVLIGPNNNNNNNNAAARLTISSLQIALASAQASASLLASQSQQLAAASATAAASAQVLGAALANAQTQSLSISLASVSAVSSAQAAAALSVASISSSAALALASANSIASAAAAATSSSRAGLAPQAESSGITRVERGMRFSPVQLAVAIVVSIIGSFILTAVAVFLCYYVRRRKRRRVTRTRKLRDLIQSPDTASSTGSGAMLWEESFNGPGLGQSEKVAPRQQQQQQMQEQRRVPAPAPAAAAAAAPPPPAVMNSDSPTLPPMGQYAAISEKARAVPQPRPSSPPEALMKPAPLQIKKESSSGMIPVTIVREPMPNRKKDGGEVVRSFSKPLSSDLPKLYVFPRSRTVTQEIVPEEMPPTIPARSPRRSQFPREVKEITF